jgi:hypothetical protein
LTRSTTSSGPRITARNTGACSNIAGELRALQGERGEQPVALRLDAARRRLVARGEHHAHHRPRRVAQRGLRRDEGAHRAAVRVRHRSSAVSARPVAITRASVATSASATAGGKSSASVRPTISCTGRPMARAVAALATR